MAATLRTYLELVRFSHTIFALPFAIMAALIAIHWGGDVGFSLNRPAALARPLVGILLCMVTARTAAMAFNRLVDRTIDAANPRTANRHLPRGDVGVGEVLLLVVVSSGAFIASTLLFLPNWLPLVLAAPVLAWLLGYSYAKRFTMLAHAWLGAALGLAPVAAWIALRGQTLLHDPIDIVPAARPSMPSAMFTAFEVPAIASVPRTRYAPSPRTMTFGFRSAPPMFESDDGS